MLYSTRIRSQKVWVVYVYYRFILEQCDVLYFRFLTNDYYFSVFFSRECAEHLFDLQTVPGRYFLELLSKFTSDEQEQEKFIEFTTSEVKFIYSEKATKFCEIP